MYRNKKTVFRILISAAFLLTLFSLNLMAQSLDDYISQLKDSSAETRARAAKGLGELKNPAAIDALATAAKDSEKSVRRRVAEALGKIGDAKGVEHLIGLLHDGDKQVCTAAAAGLKLIGSPAVGQLLDTMGDSSADVRRLAAFTLGMIKDGSAGDKLAGYMDDSDVNVQWSVIWALGELKATGAVPKIISTLQNSKVEIVRLRAAEALGKIGDGSAKVALQTATGDSSKKVAAMAKKALSKL